MKEYENFCQSCGMPLLNDSEKGTNADGSVNNDYCKYCYQNGKFTQECTMDEMIEHCAQFTAEFNKGAGTQLSKEEVVGHMKAYFPHLKRWRNEIAISAEEANETNAKLNASVAPVKKLIAELADSQPVAYISSVDYEGFPCTKAMLSPRVRNGIKEFYFTTNRSSVSVSMYRANPKACIYFCDAENFRAVMLKGTMEVLTDTKHKELIWRDGDTRYYPGGVTDPNYCVLRFTASVGRFYSDFYPRSFVIE